MFNPSFPGGGFFPGTPPGFPSPGQGPGGFPNFPGTSPFPGGGPGQFPGGPGGPGQFPGGPGGPGQFPGGPGGPGSPGGGQNVPPSSPPPSFTPQLQQFQPKAIDPGAIRGCLFRFTYVWLERDAFWFYPTFIGRRSISGFRWNGFRWVIFGIDLNRIVSFQCF
ncbi:hypothetical protein QR721_13360 [Aciduricibacillus chroicocephali]|uniref:Transporter n=1 Tax=Aciduricibacillus chroicocephali TaxID=3054939 RepID=A0ABY9KZ34_9BACI|nr:hypothetical protein QR721_13360 [Bacillaceae bacterium 44XB]